jgi:DNA-binding CsgD family transcriptional regulator
MKPSIEHYFKRLDRCVDKVRKLSAPLSEELGLSGFAYVRVYHDGRVGWVTSDSDHDRLLFDSGFLAEDPLIDTAELLKEGSHLWFHDRAFEGSEEFYRNRTQHFQLDHGMVLVNHQEEYLETGCFSGYLKRKPLYNLFVRETGIFRAFLHHFSKRVDQELQYVLEGGLELDDFKSSAIKEKSDIDMEARHRLLISQGQGELLRLSKRERENLSYLRKGMSYREIGKQMGISSRTVEHQLESVKDKLGLMNRSELMKISEKLHEFGLYL